MDESEFLSVQEAAEYIGVTPQTLRRWDSAGKLKPVRHPANGYRFYKRSDLEPFRLEYRRAEMQATLTRHLFESAVANIEGNDRLRDPQREAHRAVRQHFAAGGGSAIIQIPVGCGKTGLIATLPFGIATGRVLVITPNLTIRKGVAEALDISSTKCFWARARVLTQFAEGPFCAVLDGKDANLHDCTESHFVVTNIQQLASAADRWLPQFPRHFFDMILVDEGHHNVAESWRKVFDRFPDAKVVSLTATPFRGDEQPLAGEIIYRYSFARAMMKGYIKEVHSSNVAPAEIYFTYRDDERRHTLEEVLKLREEQWFRKGVALSPECNRHIAQASIQRCRHLRETSGVKHQIIAAACSVDHAKQVRALYEEYGLKAREIHSQMEEAEQDEVLLDLRNARLDCVVQVQMLGEGFDHPPLSVAAIFRPFRSLSPYIQFVGRVMRVVHENEPGHPDNQAFVVSHVGLNNDERWDDFRELDLDDQELLHRWVNAEEEGDEPKDGSGSPRRFDVGMRVADEIVSHFIDSAFLDPDDDRVLDQLLAQPLAGTGLTFGAFVTKEALRDKLRAKQNELRQTPEELPVSPQRRRQSARKRLAERTGCVVARVLKDLGFTIVGREVARANSSVRGLDNQGALTELLNRRVNEFLGIKSGQRKTISAEQAETALDKLDLLGDEVRDEVREAWNKDIRNAQNP